jgi:hypothetical protein
MNDKDFLKGDGKRLFSTKSKIDLINYLIKKNNFKSYLEIGIRNGKNYQSIKCTSKTGIEPFPIYWDSSMVKVKSDKFFGDTDKKWDIILVDGDHAYDQAFRDIQNSYKHLNDGGVIIVHDALSRINDNPKSGAYYLGIWKITSELNLGLKKIDGCEQFRIQTLNMDRGCVILDKFNDHAQKFPPWGEKVITWRDYVANRGTFLRLTSVERFLKNYEYEKSKGGEK